MIEERFDNRRFKVFNCILRNYFFLSTNGSIQRVCYWCRVSFSLNYKRSQFFDCYADDFLMQTIGFFLWQILHWIILLPWQKRCLTRADWIVESSIEGRVIDW